MTTLEKAKNFVSHLPIHHLGYVNYIEFPTNENYSNNTKFINITEGEQSYISSLADITTKEDATMPIAIPVTLLPDFLCNHLNCTIDVRIPRYELYDNENVYSRNVWGTDVYTDDSDPVAILYHCGILKSNDPFAGFQSLQDNDSHTSTSNQWPVYPVQADSNGTTGTEDISDVLVVRFRILPPLTAYYGCYRHAYHSRTWAQQHSKHDGVSVSVESVRWSRKSGVQRAV